MIRKTLFILIVFATVSVRGQSYDSIAHHIPGDYEELDVRNLMRMRDGSYLVNCQLFGDMNGMLYDIGNMFYKISGQGGIVLDSLFVEDHDLNRFLMQPNPFGDDYIYAKAVRDQENSRCDLCIRFFGDDLVFDDGKTVWVPLCDTLFRPLWDSYYLDEEGDIILHFPINSREEEHFFRIGIDGTVKDHSVEPFSATPINANQCTDNMGTYNDHPREYYYWGFQKNPTQCTFHVAILDSLLHVKEVLTPASSGAHYGYQDYMLNWDERSFFVASRYRNSSNDLGVCVTCYDKETVGAVKTVRFPAEGMSRPIGIGKSNDGGLYFGYSVGDWMDDGRVSVVKLDYDLNVVWQRFCLEPTGFAHEGTRLTASDDGSLAVAGVNYVYPMEWFFLGFTDEAWSISDPKGPIRPYAFYPNPVGDRLAMEFSPDVTPMSVELYDVQGRLVLSQNTALESVGMENLPAGVYTLRVTLSDGTSYTDKVVKK